MKKRLFIGLIAFALCIIFTGCEEDDEEFVNYSPIDYDYYFEDEQPELTETTKQLIRQYHQNPTEENYNKLRQEVIKNYDAVIAKKNAKLAELIEETDGRPDGDKLVEELEAIIQEMYDSYWERIDSTMLRFTDPRFLQWNTENAANYEYIPVMGAGEHVYIKRTPITNKEYAEFINSTGYRTPSNWRNKKYTTGEDDYPVNYVSYIDAEAYCNWLTTKDGINTYRIPTETEWEFAAGHIPKDAAFNCGVNDGRVSVYEYDGITRGAHGAIDFWGNVWEWTSTARTNPKSLGVKGGSWKSSRTDCRTENRKESRNQDKVYDDVGFRVIKVLN